MTENAKGRATNAGPPAGNPPASKAKRRRRAGGPGWFAPLFWLALCAALVFLRFRSFKYSDFVVFHTRSGDVQGVASHKGQVLLAVSTLSLGRERALTIERGTEPAPTFDKLYHLVYGSVFGRKEFWGFGFAATRKGDIPGDATHTAFAVPHWFLWLLAGIPAFRGVWLLTRYYTRPRRGRCRNCGYDLRGTGGAVPGARCPECGEVVAAEDDDVPAGTRRRGGKAVATLAVAILAAAEVVHVLRRSLPEVPPAHPHYSPAQVHAGYARPVGNVELDGVPLEEAVRRLAAATQTRIDVDWGELQPMDLRSTLRVSARLQSDLPLAQALQVILRHPNRGEPQLFVKDGRILVSRYRPGPPQYLVRTYDVRPFLNAISDDPLPPPPPRTTVRVRLTRPVSMPAGWSPRAQARATLIHRLELTTGSRQSYALTDEGLFPVKTTSRAPAAVHEYLGRLVVVATEEEHWRIGNQISQTLGIPPARSR